jgi:predicted secreted protein
MEIPLRRALRASGLLLIGLVACLASLTAATAQAQGQAGVSISPALIEEPLDPGAKKEYTVTIKNLNDYEQKFYLSTQDIVDVQDGGTPVFADGSLEKTGMELAGWISLGVTEITLPAGVSERVTFTLQVPGDATPGSHFGSVFISVDAPEIAQSGASIGYQVANIISIRITGDANEGANIRQFSTEKFFHGSKNVNFEARIENTGNVLVRPTGPVEIFNMLGKKVDTITFNESQGAVFPGRVREYNFNWQGDGTGFGRYEVMMSPVYGETGARKTMSSTASFWILPLNIILPALGALAFILLLSFIFVRLYIKRTLAHLAQGQTRIVRRRKNKGVSATLLLVVVMLTVTAVFMIIMLVLFA